MHITEKWKLEEMADAARDAKNPEPFGREFDAYARGVEDVLRYIIGAAPQTAELRDLLATDGMPRTGGTPKPPSSPMRTDNPEIDDRPICPGCGKRRTLRSHPNDNVAIRVFPRHRGNGEGLGGTCTGSYTAPTHTAHPLPTERRTP